MSYTLFKVLDQDGKPAHGGTGAYPMPTKTRAGAWTKAVASPLACTRGYHLTSDPSRWWTAGARLFLAEFRGKVDYHAPDKIACASVRLLKEVTHEWPLLPLYPEIRALLVSSWRAKNLAEKTMPAWANLSGAYLSGAYLSGANLSRAYLSGAYLSGADLSGADLSRANLSGADLSGAYLSGAYLSGADLSGAYLSGAYLSGADLSRANLSGANLSGADLSGADLSRANLSGAYLSGADLSRANLSGAYLSGADLSRADQVSLPAGWKLNEYGLAVRV